MYSCWGGFLQSMGRSAERDLLDKQSLVTEQTLIESVARGKAEALRGRETVPDWFSIPELRWYNRCSGKCYRRIQESMQMNRLGVCVFEGAGGQGARRKMERKASWTDV